MRNAQMRGLSLVPIVALAAAAIFAQSRPSAQPAGARAAQGAKEPLVEFEMMTWPEVKAALAAGRTTALIYTGGTEQRGPQNVNGGHTLMARETVKQIALRLGNAIAMPILAYTPNNASPELTGTIGLTNELLAAILERLTEQSIVTGFKNVVLMSDHGGGQPDVYREVAKKMDAKYASKGIRVVYCDEVYKKRQDDFYKWLADHGYPDSLHGGIADTSEMLYLGGDKGWVRKELVKDALGDPMPAPGQRGGQSASSAPRKNNGITGDGRPSTAELGKVEFQMKIDYAARQIQELLGKKAAQ